MLSNERQEGILNLLRKEKSAAVKEIAASLYVSEATVRRDLKEMQDLGLLKRSHGGAVLLERADEISIFVRMTENAREKELAAANALGHVPPFRTVFLDSSSTVLALAQRLDLSEKTVFTNSLQTAIRLSKVRGIRLVLIGGNVSPTGASVSGSWANSLLREFRFDLMLSSCAALGSACAYETSLEQRELKRTAFERSSVKILIADHTKFGANAPYLFHDFSAFDKIVFDLIPESERASLRGLPVYPEI
ncbi:MAG: DeoR/GlpR family DNA-binding transcription regulator [Clostridia bacterium]|nr:DeoR/GlpR family DNA-binding transcription regulator [Clostridia bacterium]